MANETGMQKTERGFVVDCLTRMAKKEKKNVSRQMSSKMMTIYLAKVHVKTKIYMRKLQKKRKA